MAIYLSYLILGAFAGLCAGLLGIGGGIIVVPILSLLLLAQGFPPALLMHTAVGTSLAIMIFTALSSSYAYYRRDLIVWPLFYKFVPGLLFGTIMGSLIARYLSSTHLQLAFAIFLLLIALHLFFEKAYRPVSKEIISETVTVHYLKIIIAASTIGILSGFFGIGGGSMMVPFFVYYHIEMHKATGTSALCGLPLAIVGTLTQIFTGWDLAILHQVPSGTTGYIYWPAAITVAITSVIFAPIGTRLAVWLPAKSLKRIFAMILILTAISLFFKI
ncbi:MAG TPA: sulfite exporter TauE/SafE family protein [Gammaproteobacteria bacterium]|jgi:hypothetical protein|nr:sulfite exporter TauE/SafE family protein [Gammaproteobacteria bacterium]